MVWAKSAPNCKLHGINLKKATPAVGAVWTKFFRNQQWDLDLFPEKFAPQVESEPDPGLALSTSPTTRLLICNVISEWRLWKLRLNLTRNHQHATTARRVEFCAIPNHLEGPVLDALRRVYSECLGELMSLASVNHRSCTTTPTVRRKRRKQREITAGKEVVTAREGYHSTKDDTHDTTRDETTSQSQELVTAGGLTSLSAGLPYTQTYVLANYVAFNDGYRRPIADTPVFSGPQIQLPRRLMQDLFNECVLLYCIFAVTSLVSIDPLIIGSEPLSAELTSILTTAQPVKRIKLDLRDIGRRRERAGLCHQLKVEALRQAQIEGIALWVSPESAASCYLLDALLDSEHDSPYSYGAAFSWQARTLAQSWYRQAQPYSNIGSMVADAMSALHSGRSVAFSAHDEHLICGHKQLPLENLASSLSQGCDCAREVYENISGPCARGRRFDFQAVKRYFTYLHLLYEVCDAFKTHGHLLSRQVQKQSWYILLTVRTVSAAWTNLTLYFYETIKAMLEEGIGTDLYNAGLDDSFPVTGVDCYVNGGRLAPAQLAPIFVDARALTCKAAIEFSEMIEDIYSVSRLAQQKIVGGNLKRWVQFTVDVMNWGVMSASEGIRILERLRDALKIAGFAWIDYAGLVEDINSHIAVLRASPATAQDSVHNLDLDRHLVIHHLNPNSYPNLPPAGAPLVEAAGTGVSQHEPPVYSGYMSGPLGSEVLGVNSEVWTYDS
ncbi:hypothetical protein D9758_003751 [Tetrapyrgos nigripes]|uniref:Uncharacterized protein n=1 Tax=Tetrapyrgos nigripes TaxID=182062 RepID=A0A8H5LS20_9AGAR|nr:hypothetical protein D9758_003751 [Tetrapyrgos nigripes]